MAIGHKFHYPSILHFKNFLISRPFIVVLKFKRKSLLNLTSVKYYCSHRILYSSPTTIVNAKINRIVSTAKYYLAKLIFVYTHTQQGVLAYPFQFYL